MESTSSSHWCYNCSRFVNVSEQDSILCCNCQGGFVERIENPPPQSTTSAAMLVFGSHSNPNSNTGWLGFLRRRSRAEGLPYNTIIALRGPNISGGGVEDRRIEFYSYDGANSRLQPLPANESEFLISSGFHHRLDGWANIAVNALGNNHRPTSKAAIDSMPVIEIGSDHVVNESHCAVCKEDFEIGSEAREMPCNHLYHSDCILPWLSMRNSCPLCRHELPTANPTGSQEEQLTAPSEENNGAFGLVIWRLPTRSLAVVRFSGGRPEAERLIAFFATSIEANTGVSVEHRARESGALSGFFRRVSSLFGRNRSASTHSEQQRTPVNETAM